VATDACERASPPGCWLARLLSGVPHTTAGAGLGLDEAVNRHGPSAQRGGTVLTGFGTARARCRLSGGPLRSPTGRKSVEMACKDRRATDAHRSYETS
jgi:hypothetical protein